jgi:hypothetical protein
MSDTAGAAKHCAVSSLYLAFMCSWEHAQKVFVGHRLVSSLYLAFMCSWSATPYGLARATQPIPVLKTGLPTFGERAASHLRVPHYLCFL